MRSEYLPYPTLPCNNRLENIADDLVFQTVPLIFLNIMIIVWAVAFG
jgi:hypothetical protein